MICDVIRHDPLPFPDELPLPEQLLSQTQLSLSKWHRRFAAED